MRKDSALENQILITISRESLTTCNSVSSRNILSKDQLRLIAYKTIFFCGLDIHISTLTDSPFIQYPHHCSRWSLTKQFRASCAFDSSSTICCGQCLMDGRFNLCQLLIFRLLQSSFLQIISDKWSVLIWRALKRLWLLKKGLGDRFAKKTGFRL